jgi:hypothetical protein
VPQVPRRTPLGLPLSDFSATRRPEHLLGSDRGISDWNFANAHSFSAAMLLDRDYRWCAEGMLRKFGSRALSRAERRAQELLADGNLGGYEIWIRVAATIQQIQANAQAA